MIVKKIVFVILLFSITHTNAQVGIGTVAPASTLDVVGQPTITNVLDGVIAPRLTGVQLRAKTYTVAQTGALVYATAADTAPAGQTINVITIGYYFFNGTIWVAIANGNSDGWKLLGNAGTTPGSNFIGTTDNQDLVFKRNNVVSGKIKMFSLSYGVDALNLLSSGNYNTAIGNNAMKANSTGTYNSGFGYNSLLTNTIGSFNTALGTNSLVFNTTGSNNTSNGARAMQSNTLGSDNSAFGSESLFNNTTGIQNTASGTQSLYFNVTGNYNSANGYRSLYQNISGNENVASGAFALNTNTTGSGNTANGYAALGINTTGSNNVATGNSSLIKNSTGNFNTANGVDTLINNETGIGNMASGYKAMYFNTIGSGNVALGRESLLSNSDGNSNIAIGASALGFQTTGNNNIGIGEGTNVTTLTGSNQMSIANVIYGNNMGATATGNIGIRNNTPTEALDVLGKTKTTNLQVPTGTAPIIGQVLTATDITGNMSWQTPIGAVGGFTHYLGEAFNGGIIYYLYKGSDGFEHGLIVALTESTGGSSGPTGLKWQTSNTLVNANRSEDGFYNTGLMTSSPAASYIAGLGVGWYLPSIDELSLLYSNMFTTQKALRAGGNTLLTTNNSYWSSTEYNASDAYYFYFLGYAYFTNKVSVACSVRGVKAF